MAHSYILLQTVVSILAMAIRGIGPDWGFFLGSLLVTAQVTIVAASVVMFSTILAEFPTISFSAMYLLMGILMSLLDALITCAPFEVGLRMLLRIVYYSAPNFNLFVSYRLAEAATSWKFVLGAAGYTLFYTALLAWLGMWAFSRREFSKH